MKTKRNLRNVSLSLSLMTAAAMMAACGTKNNDPEPQPGKAMFDNFSYKGMDKGLSIDSLPDKGSFFNPILPGWYSDPTICTNGEGDYFLATSTFTYFPGVPLFHSRDLVNWEQKGHILSRPSQLVNMEGQHVSGGIFAPDLKYNPANKTYYMITTNVGAGNFFVKTTDPFGEWSDPIYLPEVVGIDPSFFFDDNGKAYIVNNDDAPDGKAEYPGHRTVRIVEFDTNTDKCVGERKIIVNKGWRPEDKPIWCEGPHIYKINGEYYLMTAEGGTGDWHSEVIYRGETPFGPYTPWQGNPILTQRTLDRNRPNPITCAGHADLVQAKEGDWWAVFLACRPIDHKFENLGRETYMLPVKWTEDGWPYMTQGDEVIPRVVTREGVERKDTTTFGNFERDCDFSTAVLGDEWMTLRHPSTEYYSLTENPGYLTIDCAPVELSEKTALPFVSRRLQHHGYECSTHMVFQPTNAEEKAGMMLYKDETHHYMLARGQNDEGVDCVFVKKVDKDGSDIIASQPIDPAVKAIDLKVASDDGLTLTMLYSIDGGRNWEVLASGVDASLTSTAKAGGFTGTNVGLFATSK